MYRGLLRTLLRHRVIFPINSVY